MREALVEADAQPDAPREGRRQLVEGPLVALVAAAEHGELRVGRREHLGQGRGEEVETLLLGQARDDAEHRDIGEARELEFRL